MAVSGFDKCVQSDLFTKVKVLKSEMEIKRLNSDVISKIRSSFNLNSVAQCIFELVCNSLDAKSTSVAVRINLITFKIQVADNGEGITKENLDVLGIRYMTNKCHNIRQLEKHLNTYGFRGEALASLVDMCKSLGINSRCKNSSDTYNTTLSKGLRNEVKLTKHRASVGTTVTVLGFLSTFPVRRQRVIQEIELEDVRKYMESLVIINPGTSFTLRNDVTGLLMLKSPKNSDIIGSFRHLHPDISDSFTLLKISKNKVSVDALIHKEFIVSKKFQYVYVNKRPVLSHKILKTANESFYKKMQLKTKRNKHPIYETKRYPVYVLNIKCPQCYVDVLMGPSKSDVEFKCWDLVLNCIEKIIKTFFGLEDQKENKIAVERKESDKVNYGVSQVVGAVQACAFKRKSDGNPKTESVTQNSVKVKPVGVKKSKVESFVKDKTGILPSQKTKLSGNYQIEDSGKQEPPPKPRKLKSIIKKPLPIKVQPKTYQLESKINDESVFDPEPSPKPDQARTIDISDLRKGAGSVFDQQLVPKAQFDQKSVYSRLNADENQGKDLIMDMFLKSTQVFTGEDGKSRVSEKTCPNISGDTIEESNFVMENNIRDTVRGINTTMSISVNVKKKKLKYYNKKVSKCIQTSVLEGNQDKLASKCVQTSQKRSLTRVRSNLSDLTHQFDGFKLSHDLSEEGKDNYTILINTVCKKREFRFVRKSEEMDVDGSDEEQNFRPLKICHCYEDDGKIFRFGKANKRAILSVDDGNKKIPISTLKGNLFEKPCAQKSQITERYCLNQEDNNAIIFKKPQAATITEPKLSIRNQKCDNRIRNNLNFQGIIKQSGANIVNIDLCGKSPYFGKKTIPKVPVHRPNFSNNNTEQRTEFIQLSYTDFQPKFKSTQFRQNYLQEAESDNDLQNIRNDIVASPYFSTKCRKDDDFPQKNNVYFSDVIRNGYVQCQNECHNNNNNTQLQNHLNTDYPVENLKLVHPKERCVLLCPNFEQNYLKLRNIKNANQMQQNVCSMRYNNCCRPSNTNILPYCLENSYPPNPGINYQYFEVPRENANDFERQKCCKKTCNHYKGDVWQRNCGNFNVESRVANIYPQNNVVCPKPRGFVKSTRVQPPGLENNDLHRREDFPVFHKNAPVEVNLDNLNMDKKERHNIRFVKENEHNPDLEEAPWFPTVEAKGNCINLDNVNFDKKKRQSMQFMKENQQNPDLDEAPWYPTFEAKGNCTNLDNVNFVKKKRQSLQFVKENHDNLNLEEAPWYPTVEAKGDCTNLDNDNFDKKERQSVQIISQYEQNPDLEEAPWYTPHVSDENMFLERTFSSLEVKANQKAAAIDDVPNLPAERRRATDPKLYEEQINTGTQRFNFKFSCTPDIFSCDVVSETERDPPANKKIIDKYAASSIIAEKNMFNGFQEPVTKEGFKNFFDLASFGIVESIDPNRTTDIVPPSREGSNLEITLLDDQEKNNLIEQELMDVEKNNRGLFCSGESEVKVEDRKKKNENEEGCNEKSRIIVDSQNEWVRKLNEAGTKFYVNRRTGMAITNTPKIEQELFCFEKRLDFIPKGMSPVLKEHKKIDRSLSQNARSKLHDFILEGYENELMVIKWQNYIYDDPKTFFEEIYKEKSKQFENEIPTIQDSAGKHKFKGDIVGFNKQLFETVEVIGQVDKKFIAVLEKTKKLIILFDQHAVHERIRVEQLLKGYKGQRAPCKKKLTLFMPRNDLGLLKNHSAYLSSVGLDVEYFTNGLKIVNVPLCLQEKFGVQDNSEDLSKIIHILIKDILQSLKATRGSTTQLPKIIQNVVNLKACRGAIKFGDSLTKEDCVKLLNDLATCNLPFQCAHGRPTLTPVLTLSKVQIKEKNNKLNLKKLLQ